MAAAHEDIALKRNTCLNSKKNIISIVVVSTVL